ncbi:uncharacterized protein LOC122832752 isoform X1 [Gambusia affinis]|uniref:uncharacterized protein LOC122832752 isoform X1 n=1 Tax=Gambusia affinis TaxID=33528 RepID=UPI001CDC2948|nr:uncharacterized protein LOC122832752 isoform X1 [Gambusia affinis]
MLELEITFSSLLFLVWFVNRKRSLFHTSLTRENSVQTIITLWWWNTLTHDPSQPIRGQDHGDVISSTFMNRSSRLLVQQLLDSTRLSLGSEPGRQHSAAAAAPPGALIGPELAAGRHYGADEARFLQASWEWPTPRTSSGEEAAGSQGAAAVVQQIPSARPTVIRIPAGRKGGGSNICPAEPDLDLQVAHLEPAASLGLNWTRTRTFTADRPPTIRPVRTRTGAKTYISHLITGNVIKSSD